MWGGGEGEVRGGGGGGEGRRGGMGGRSCWQRGNLLAVLGGDAAGAALRGGRSRRQKEERSTSFNMCSTTKNIMNSQLLAQLAEKKSLAPSLSRAQLARNLSSHLRRAAAAAAAEASAPAPVLDDDAKTSVACVQVHQKTRIHPERAPQFRGKVTKSEQRQRLVMCVQQPRGNYIAQTGPGYSAQ